MQSVDATQELRNGLDWPSDRLRGCFKATAHWHERLLFSRHSLKIRLLLPGRVNSLCSTIRQAATLQPLTHLKYPLPPSPPATAADLSNHLSHTPETPKQPPPQSALVLSCAGDKRSFSVFTSGLREVNGKSVHWDLRVSRPKRPLEPPLTPQSKRQRLLKNAPRLFLPPLSLFLYAAAFLHQLSKKYCSFILLSFLSLWQHSQALLISSFVWVGQIPPQEGC